MDYQNKEITNLISPVMLSSLSKTASMWQSFGFCRKKLSNWAGYFSLHVGEGKLSG